MTAHPTAVTPAEAPIPWRRLVAWFVASRLVILGFAALTLRFVERGPHFRPPQSALDWLKQWDSFWYYNVIEHGYAFDPTRMSNVNFLPLYPMLVKAVMLVGLRLDVAGYLVSNAACLGAAALLWRLAAGISGTRSADAAVAFFLLGPVSFFFATIYSEATFICAALAAMVAARQERWGLAGWCGAAAALTRSVGVLLVVPLVVELLQRHGRGHGWRSGAWWGRLLCCAAPVVALAGYLAFLSWRFGEPRAYFISQRFGGHGFAWFWDVFVSRHFLGLTPFYRAWFGGTVVGGMLLLLAGLLLRQPRALTMFALACCALYFSQRSLEGLPRFLSVVFPFYCTLGLITARWRPAGCVLLAVSVCLLAIAVTRFVGGYWFT